MSDFICGIDTGGTFTDCVVVDAAGRIVTAKAPSTPEDFSQGVLDSLGLAAGRLGLTTEALLRRTSRLALGTTVGTNALLQRRGARVGLITTRGHRDVIHIMRGARGVPGVASEQVLHFPESSKPTPPIVPKTLIAEVSERVDCQGQVVVALNEDEARAAVRRLVAKGVQSIAICFLWSFKHPDHERRVKAMVEEMAPGLFASCSADLVPRWGEYERTAATVINAYLGPV
ncbi:MAG TPA: hydantoinase/oxoprolinase N-terminal domain-containing protein, partial [Candidatus Methylomirabilis sp.]|nr:hydantoinase/oxoprolinase N-terminal domain-containing protein [Candidatus Methylomirabilis sp.]